MTKARILLLVIIVGMGISAYADSLYKKFYNLTAEEVKIDSMLPIFKHSLPLDGAWADSIYTATLEYAEYIDMSSADVKRLQTMGINQLPKMPSIDVNVVVSRKEGTLEISFVPLVMRGKSYKKLVSFMLDVRSSAIKKSGNSRTKAASTVSAADRYVANSVLATGRWAKIRVPKTGIYRLSEDVVRRAGFSDINKVKIYGYGGALQNETLREEDIIDTDDLKEVPTCIVEGKRLFHAQGPVSWSSNTVNRRTRNPYSDYGYYFLTETSDEPLTVDSLTFVDSFYPSADDYHTLHEIDNYAWYHGGRNLFENSPIEKGKSKTYTLVTPKGDGSGKRVVYVVATTGTHTTFEIAVNGETKGTYSHSFTVYDHGKATEAYYEIPEMGDTTTVTLTTISGGPVLLDHISICQTTPRARPQLASSVFDTPEYVYNITNQNHHADGPADMIIIIPASAKLLTQAQRLKEAHETHDGMRVRIVPADELYNEFSSGTPDANAYRKYLKMLYDRAENVEDMPSHLLLFGDGVWDNRLNSPDCKMLNANDLLLCYESEDSYSQVSCYVNEGFFCCLDDGEGGDPKAKDKLDMTVGRFPVRNEAEAKIMVDRTIQYMENKNAGEWQNVMMFMGDDGNNNQHMKDADDIATLVEDLQPALRVKRVLWDAYPREVTATGNSYPEAKKIVLKQQSEGALVMNYSGHGSPDFLSHEKVLTVNDFEAFVNDKYPLWLTAACDIVPFDSQDANIGEAAVLNNQGGALAFIGTTRTVYTDRNKAINTAFMRYLLTKNDGKYPTIGEALRLAKNSLITSSSSIGNTVSDATENKLHYVLMGDPAVRLNIPRQAVVVDSINGVCLKTATTLPELKAGSIIKVKGHVETAENNIDEDCQGVVTALVRDSKQLILCKLNDTSKEGASTPYQYYDRNKVLFNGSNNIINGKFEFSFAMPLDIDYSNEQGLINLFATNKTTNETLSGYSEDFTVGGTSVVRNDSIGPSIYCYLNSPTFVDGDNINTTPYFYAQLSDKDGLNTSGSGIGHDLLLTIDGKPEYTYVLNDNFTYDFGSYTSGSTFYSLPELTPGKHRLMFRAWDILNNSSTAELTFNVVKSLKPDYFNIDCSSNPARSSTTFIVNHDRSGSNLDITIDVFDITGRPLWTHTERGVTTTGTYTLDWDLNGSNGRQLATGIYIYRVRMSSDGSGMVSKAKKLIVIRP